MFFVASKILAFVAVPSNIFISLIIVGTLVLFTRFARVGRRFIVTGMMLIVLVGLSPLGAILLRLLEDRFPPWDATRGEPTGFIILGGALNPEISAARQTPVLHESAERVTIVAELVRSYPSARFIYTGGNGYLRGGPAEGDYIGPLFESFGIGKDRIVLEPNARNTVENAEYSKAIAVPKAGDRWVVVTTGTHMPRAIGAFRALGFDVEAYSVDWRTGGASETFGLYAVFTFGLGNFDAAIHEFVGLLAYRLTGRSSELFPAPR